MKRKTIYADVNERKTKKEDGELQWNLRPGGGKVCRSRREECAELRLEKMRERGTGDLR